MEEEDGRNKAKSFPRTYIMTILYKSLIKKYYKD